MPLSGSGSGGLGCFILSFFDFCMFLSFLQRDAIGCFLYLGVTLTHVFISIQRYAQEPWKHRWGVIIGHLGMTTGKKCIRESVWN